MIRLSELKLPLSALPVDARRASDAPTETDADRTPAAPTPEAALRQLVAQALALCDRTGSMAALCYMDLNGFKPINDQLGHAAGDETLQDVAQLLVKNSREMNVVARYGGDEFVILLQDTGKVGAQACAERDA